MNMGSHFMIQDVAKIDIIDSCNGEIKAKELSFIV